MMWLLFTLCLTQQDVDKITKNRVCDALCKNDGHPKGAYDRIAKECDCSEPIKYPEEARIKLKVDKINRETESIY